VNKVLLDTDIFSEILKRKNKKVIENAKTYHANFGKHTISTITVMEIVKGFHKLHRENSLQKFLNALPDVEILTMDLQSSIMAGRIYGDLERTGQPIGRADPMIAAIALQHDLTVVTGNIKHYERIQNLGYDLKLDNWKS